MKGEYLVIDNNQIVFRTRKKRLAKRYYDKRVKRPVTVIKARVIWEPDFEVIPGVIPKCSHDCGREG